MRKFNTLRQTQRIWLVMLIFCRRLIYALIYISKTITFLYINIYNLEAPGGYPEVFLNQ